MESYKQTKNTWKDAFAEEEFDGRRRALEKDDDSSVSINAIRVPPEIS